jgi:hypothetical protein
MKGPGRALGARRSLLGRPAKAERDGYGHLERCSSVVHDPSRGMGRRFRFVDGRYDGREGRYEAMDRCSRSTGGRYDWTDERYSLERPSYRLLRDRYSRTDERYSL